MEIKTLVPSFLAREARVINDLVLLVADVSSCSLKLKGNPSISIRQRRQVRVAAASAI